MKFLALLGLVISIIGLLLPKTETLPDKCGVVIDKGKTLEKSKHNVWLDETLVVKYPSGIEEVKVTTDTYYTTEKGEFVCFKNTNTSILPLLMIVYGGLFFIILGSVYLIIEYE